MLDCHSWSWIYEFNTMESRPADSLQWPLSQLPAASRIVDSSGTHRLLESLALWGVAAAQGHDSCPQLKAAEPWGRLQGWGGPAVAPESSSGAWEHAAVLTLNKPIALKEPSSRGQEQVECCSLLESVHIMDWETKLQEIVSGTSNSQTLINCRVHLN